MKEFGKRFFSALVQPNRSVAKHFVAFLIISLPLCVWLGVQNHLGILGVAIIAVIFGVRGLFSAIYWRLLSMGQQRFDAADHSQIAKRNDAK